MYRVVLRCRQLARERFAKLRSDVLVKLELLDQKHGEFKCSLFRAYPCCIVFNYYFFLANQLGESLIGTTLGNLHYYIHVPAV